MDTETTFSNLKLRHKYTNGTEHSQREFSWKIQGAWSPLWVRENFRILTIGCERDNEAQGWTRVLLHWRGSSCCPSCLLSPSVTPKGSVLLSIGLVGESGGNDGLFHFLFAFSIPTERKVSNFKQHLGNDEQQS